MTPQPQVVVIEVKPKRKRKLPADGYLRTRTVVEKYLVLFTTDLNGGTTTAIWDPPRPKELGDLRTGFLRARLKHMQRIADALQQTVSVKDEQ